MTTEATLQVRSTRLTRTKYHIALLLGDLTIYHDEVIVTSQKARSAFLDAATAIHLLQDHREAIERELDRVALEATSPEPTGDHLHVQGAALVFEEPQPWLDAVDGPDLLEEIRGELLRYVALPPHADVAITLWVMHTYTPEVADFSPRLFLTSAEKRSGKSRTLRLIAALVRRPLAVENITSAALFRTVEAHKPTLLLDEGDAWLVGPHADDGLRGLLNAGCEPDGQVLRCVGDDAEPRAFGVYAPVAIAMIGRAPATIEDRSIIVPMRRAAPGEPIERMRLRKVRQQLADTRRRCARFTADHLAALRDADPKLPAVLDDRAADAWRPLVAIADAAGGAWPERARAAAVALSGGRDAEDGSKGSMLLRDVREFFDERKTDRILSKQLAEALVRREDRSWSEWGPARRPITPAGIASLLKPYGIRPRNVRLDDDRQGKGYDRADFVDAWSRYAPTPCDPVSEPSQRPSPATAGVPGQSAPVPAGSLGRQPNGIQPPDGAAWDVGTADKMGSRQLTEPDRLADLRKALGEDLADLLGDAAGERDTLRDAGTLPSGLLDGAGLVELVKGRLRQKGAAAAVATAQAVAEATTAGDAEALARVEQVARLGAMGTGRSRTGP